MEILQPRLKFKTHYTFLRCLISDLYFKHLHICKCSSVLAAAQGFFMRHFAILDGFRLCLIQWPPKIAVGVLWTVAAMPVSQQPLHLNRTGMAELKFNQISGISPVAKWEEMHDQIQPNIHRRRLPYSLPQELLTHVCDLKDLKIH